MQPNEKIPTFNYIGTESVTFRPLEKDGMLVPQSVGPSLSPTLAANEKVKKLRAEGRKVLHMGFGEAPFFVPETLEKQLQAAAFRKDYVASAGEEVLRNQILKYYCDDKKILGRPSSEYDCLVSSGSKMTLFLIQMAIPGDLLVCEASWVSYGPQSAMLKNKIWVVSTIQDDKENCYRIDPEVLRKTIWESRKLGGNPTKFIINFPNNPTGLSMPDENMKQVAEILQEEGILLISDEIYGFTSYDEIYREREGKKEDHGVFIPSYRSFARFTPNNVIVTSGLSKAQSLGGWRLGFGIIPKGLVDRKNNNFPLFTLLTMLQAETTSCIPAPISQACVLAFKNDPCVEEQIKVSTRIHEVVSRYMATEVRKMGVKCPIPAGAFYFFPEWTEHAEKIRAFFPKIQNAQDLADHFAETYGLIALPSSCFLCEKSRLALRCALQDYNGKIAFQNASRLFITKELSEEEYIKTYMPNLVECLVCFRDFCTKVGMC